MEMLGDVLPILLYILGSILLVVLIILGIKLIQTVDRTNELLDSVEQKVSSLNGLFNVIDSFSSTIAVVGDRFIDGVTGWVSNFFHKRKKKKEKETDKYE